ncbi:glycerol kinase GlpK [Natronomonas halophila]|uniref:glycerol kinase GlpK n=1 Tax=Natronomonas halophila TaxID=2747817 RepID=UPI0015B4D8E1|nr:glycerol kinase GlpK [Natronomonas halophila]QLD87240.1 glycerol kinase GlpK [Natronomonas halophila]
MAYVAAIDQGTTGTRSMVFDREGRVHGQAYETHEQRYPEPGWVEHDPEEIYDNAVATLQEAIDVAGVDPAEIAALGVTNQRETTVLWDAETGDPVHDAIVWQDRRTTERVERLREEGRAAAIRRKTGLQPDAYFSATKLEWLLDNADPIAPDRGRGADVRERAEAGDLCFGTIDSWLIWNLTGEHVTDVTNASRTLLFDIHEMAWDEDLLAEFDVPEAVLPEVRPSSDAEIYGYTDHDTFGAEIPVTAALGDQQAALFGQTCFDAGDAKNTYGTGSFLLLNTGEEAVDSDHGLLTTVAFQRSGEPVQYALEGSIFVTGAAIGWLEDVDLIDDAAETERLAREVDSTDGVYFVPAFTGLGAPHWDQRARGTMVGLTRGTERAHIVRATLEAIAYQTRDVVEAMVEDSGLELTDLRVDGGAVKNNFLCGLQADILESDIVRPVVDETTALGAAYAAGLAVDYWESVDELRENWRVDREFEPTPSEDIEDRYERWSEAVERAKGWARE